MAEGWKLAAFFEVCAFVWRHIFFLSKFPKKLWAFLHISTHFLCIFLRRNAIYCTRPAYAHAHLYPNRHALFQ